jgi:ribosome modulation factor
MLDTPIWLLPQGFNINEVEGREAYRDGYGLDTCPYGDSAAATEWKNAWRAEDLKTRI